MVYRDDSNKSDDELRKRLRLRLRKTPTVQKRMNVQRRMKKAVRMSKVTNSNRLLGLTDKDMKLNMQMKMMGRSRMKMTKDMRKVYHWYPLTVGKTNQQTAQEEC